MMAVERFGAGGQQRERETLSMPHFLVFRVYGLRRPGGSLDMFRLHAQAV